MKNTIKTASSKTDGKKMPTGRIRLLLVAYDLLAYLASCVFVFFCLPERVVSEFIFPALLGLGSLFGIRFLFRIYKQIWRFGGTSAYLRLLLADGCAFWLFFALEFLLPSGRLTFENTLLISCLTLLLTTAMRFTYRYAYQHSGTNSNFGRVLRTLLRTFARMKVSPDDNSTKKTNIAIVGVESIGVILAEELVSNPLATYKPVCFIALERMKAGKQVWDLPVISAERATKQLLDSYGIEEVILALPQMDAEDKKNLFDMYKKMGYKVRAYDYPVMQSAQNGKRFLRDFDIVELLSREPVDFSHEATGAYYRDKTVLITGGGGSIGSELCRQLATMEPKKLVILDVYENGAYDVQQELNLHYHGAVDVVVEILSVCDRKALEKVFATHRPHIVLHAAAHKHVPLMERNCCEAVKNNVFGTLNAVELAEQYGVESFIMVSTDKAVNPTNVMGATKRMCEMIVQSHSLRAGATKFSATRFGNVLGSAGSVIPLFKRQIENGGPVTLTDLRIVRYFMTIPEASQLVLQSGAMAKKGELFVLDMGRPVKILELAENMIKLAGMEPYRDIDIIETGLRPGEKLYEELLIKKETLVRTDNRMIFIEKDEALSESELAVSLSLLANALATENDEAVRIALKKAVPTYRSPEEVNACAEETEEMKQAEGAVPIPCPV